MANRISRTREEILKGVTVKDGYVWVTCHNCGGTGEYPSSATPAGRCRLYCWNFRTPETYGKLSISVEKYVKREQRRDRREHRRQQKEKARQAHEEMQSRERMHRSLNLDPRIEDLATEFGLSVPASQGEFNTINDHTSSGSSTTALDLAWRWVAYGKLSDKQWALVETLTERRRTRNEERANRKPCPMGRLTIEGEVIKVEERHTSYGTRDVMTVKTDAGWLAWGTIPRGFAREAHMHRGDDGTSYGPLSALRGLRIRFNAQLEPSGKDEHFGFFKRPTKAEIL